MLSAAAAMTGARAELAAGDIAGARAVLTLAEAAPLVGAQRSTLSCVQSAVALAEGDLSRARRALTEAESIAARIGTPTDAPLGRALARVATAIEEAH